MALREIAPRFSGKMAERQAEIIKEAGQATLEAYEINTRLRIAHSRANLPRVRRLHHGGICQRCCLEGRKDLGNVKKGDGRLYKGRGLP
jgi:putative chitinase